MLPAVSHQSLSFYRRLACPGIVSLYLSTTSAASGPVTTMIRTRLLTRQLQTWSRLSRSRPVVSTRQAEAFPKWHQRANKYDYLVDGASTKIPLWKKVSPVLGVGFFVYAVYKAYADYQDSINNPPFDLDIPPVEFPSSAEELLALQNRRVKLRGRFDHENEVCIGPRKNLQVPPNSRIPYWSTDGYYVLTPFILSDGGIRILVNRGWVATHRLDPAKRSLGQIEGEVELNAYVTSQEQLDVISEVRASMRLEKWMYSGTPTEINMKWFSKNLNVSPLALFVADKDNAPRNGPVGGQFSIPEGQYRYVSTVACLPLAWVCLRLPFTR